MSAGDGIAAVPAAEDAPQPVMRLRYALLTGAVWLGGSAIVAGAQPDSDRRLAAAGAAAAGVVTILALARLTEDPARRYVRSVFGAVVAVSLTSDWLLWRLGVSSSGYVIAGMVERIVLPLLVVLLLPLTARALWEQRAALVRSRRPLDWIVGAYGTIVLVPALILGLAHHDRLLYVAQDLGLIVFFVFMYFVGRAAQADAVRASAVEIVEVLLLLIVADYIVFHWAIAPLYSYIEAAAAGALAFLVLRPRASRPLSVGVALALLAADAVAITHGAQASVAVELGGALGVLAFLLVRSRRLIPLWLIVAGVIVALVGFVGFTSDGATLRGQYHGVDPSNAGRTYEAMQIRSAVGKSPLSLALGNGLGATIDETQAAPIFAQSLVYGGRDLAHVQEVHLLAYSFLLKTGFLGLAWLAAFTVGLAVAVLRGLERAAQERDPRLVLFAALPLLAVVQAYSTASHLQADPLNALTLGMLVATLGGRQALAGSIRTHRRQLLAAAVCTLAGSAAISYVGAHRAPATQPVAAPVPQPVALWIGDSYTAGAGATSSATGEALATSAALGWQTDMDAEGATGYVVRGHKLSRSNKAVPARIATDAASFPGVSVVLIDAGRNDLGQPAAKFHRAVVSTFNSVAKDFPLSAVVVIAPYLIRSKPHAFLALRRLLRRQARIRHWAFVDPIAQGWINRASAKLVASDGTHPNQQGYDYIVAHLAPAIEKALKHAHEHVRINCTKAAPCRRRVPRTR